MNSSPRVSVLRLGAVLASVRLSAFGYLLFRHWSHSESLSDLPLVFALFPEGLVIPGRLPWTVPQAVGFAALLMFGSLAMERRWRH